MASTDDREDLAEIIGSAVARPAADSAVGELADRILAAGYHRLATAVIHVDDDDGSVTVDFLTPSGYVSAGMDLHANGVIVASIVGGDSDRALTRYRMSSG